MSRFSVSALILFSGLLHPAFASIGLRTGLWSVYDGNSYKTAFGSEDYVIQPDAALMVSAGDARASARFGYKGSLYLFKNETERRFGVHGPFGEVLWRPGDRGPAWTLSGAFERRLDRTVFADLDYSRWAGSAGLRQEKRGRYTAGLTFSGQRQTFAGYPSLDFNEFRASVQANRYFRSRTAVLLQAMIGQKRYLEDMTAEIEEQIIIPQTVGGRGGSGRGKGPGAGSSTGGDSIYTITRTIRTGTEGMRPLLLTGSARLTRSLGRSVGTAAQVLRSWNFNREGRYLTTQESGYLSEDPLFDDPYTHETAELSVEATVRFSGGWTAKGSWQWEKRYFGRPVYDMNGIEQAGTKRKDIRTLTGVLLRGPIGMKGSFLTVSGFWADNLSNDPYYRYDGALISAGFEMNR
ncbi:MAG: hypothetical protein QUS35_08170 [bacterium]|nr:hypothetical protein [bacterium]